MDLKFVGVVLVKEEGCTCILRFPSMKPLEDGSNGNWLRGRRPLRHVLSLVTLHCLFIRTYEDILDDIFWWCAVIATHWTGRNFWGRKMLVEALQISGDASKIFGSGFR